MSLTPQISELLIGSYGFNLCKVQNMMSHLASNYRQLSVFCWFLLIVFDDCLCNFSSVSVYKLISCIFSVMYLTNNQLIMFTYLCHSSLLLPWCRSCMECSNQANQEDQLPLAAQKTLTKVPKTLTKVPWSFLSWKIIKECQ